MVVGIPGSIDYDKLHRSCATFDKRWSNLIFCEQITLKTCEGSRIPVPFAPTRIPWGPFHAKVRWVRFVGLVCFRLNFAMKKTAQTCVFFGILWMTNYPVIWRLPMSQRLAVDRPMCREVSDVSLKFTMAMLLFFYWNVSEAPAKALAKEEWLFGPGILKIRSKAKVCEKNGKEGLELMICWCFRQTTSFNPYLS